MTTMHPTCTELASCPPSGAEGALARHLKGCSRCRELQAMLEAEGAELERLLPAVELLKALEELPDSEPGRASAPPVAVTLPASVRSACRARLSAAVGQLDFDHSRHLVWPEGARNELPLGDLSDLRGYLEGLWLEEWSATDASSMHASARAALAADIDASVSALRPRLEALGWLASGARSSRASHRLLQWPLPLRKPAWQAALLAAPLVALLLLWDRVLPSPGGLGSVARQQAPQDLVAKGSQGLPPLVVVIKRGEALLEYEGRAVILPGDRLRLRFHLEQEGPVLAGILTAEGEWVTFFDQRFAAGDHSPRATLSVDARPSSGRILLGEPSRVRAALSGGGEAGLHALDLVWKPAFPSNPWDLGAELDQ